MRLEGRVALITGAASGFGRAMAERFAEEGAEVAIADIDMTWLAETAQRVQEHGREALVVRCDVSKRAEIQAGVEATVQCFGKLTTMVANAGTVERAGFLDLTDEEWDRVQAVDLRGVFVCNQIAARQMIAQGEGGQIINTGSQLGEVGAPLAPSYTAAKAGVKNLTKSAAVALAPHGIRVNCIGPGPVPTRIASGLLGIPEVRDHFERHVALGHLGEPLDIANAAVFLASDESSWVTGETIMVDGGYLLNSFRAPEVDEALRRARADAGR
ncbi:MAG: SDR family oxidoreductase [Chloroflexi bacterium]|nr:SDR family oxidoreductase [Chloroflexota bacterium]